MEKQYKIKSIRHSGTYGPRGFERTDGRYPMRVGRIVKLDIDKLRIRDVLVLDYVKDEHGNDYSGMCLRCSIIRAIHKASSNLICVETNNSIYELESEERECL